MLAGKCLPNSLGFFFVLLFCFVLFLFFCLFVLVETYGALVVNKKLKNQLFFFFKKTQF